MAMLLALGMLGCQNASSRAEAQFEEVDSGASRAKASGTKNRGSGAEASEESGKAVFPVTVHDFGEVEEGESISHVFKIRNVGHDPLHIGRVRGS